jgi:hypothetical protein
MSVKKLSTKPKQSFRVLVVRTDISHSFVIVPAATSAEAEAVALDLPDLCSRTFTKDPNAVYYAVTVLPPEPAEKRRRHAKAVR